MVIVNVAYPSINFADALQTISKRKEGSGKEEKEEKEKPWAWVRGYF